MKLLSLNIQHGGGNRDAEILRIVEEQSPNILVLTEYRRNATGARLVSQLRERGFEHHVDSKPEGNANAVLIVSRSPIEKLAMPLALSQAHEQRVVIARTEGLDVCGVYFPGKRVKELFWRDEFLPLAASLQERRCLLVGDFNTGKHLIDEAGKTFYGAEYLGVLENAGWTDAWRFLHPDERDFTWYSTAGNGFRIDHCWLSPVLKSELQDAWHLHEARTRGATDHSGLVVSLIGSSSL